MVKTLLPKLTVIILLIACQKQNEIVQQSHNENAKSITAPLPGPIAVKTPRLFFLEDISNTQDNKFAGNLYSVDNLGALKLTAVKNFSFVDNNNLPFFLHESSTWAYNTNTDEILTSDLNILPSISTIKLELGKLKKIIDFGHVYCIRINPANDKIFALSGEDVLPGSEIWVSDIKGANPVKIFTDASKNMSAMDIDFVNGKIYTLDVNTNSIFVMDINGKNNKKISSVILGETIVKINVDPVLRVDPSQNKLFLSTHTNKFQFSQKFRLWSLNTTGTGWKKLFEATDPTPPKTISKSFFSFDIWPGNKIFYTLQQNVTNFPINLIGRMNMDGTQRTDFFASRNSIRDVIVALPKSLN